MNDLVVVFLIGLVSSSVLAYPIFRALIALKSRQTVSQYVAEHAHKQGTPTMGGLIILSGTFAGLSYWSYKSGLEATLPVWVMMVGYALIGFVDDFVLPRVKKGSRGFGWIPKLLLQIVIASLAVWLSKDSISASSASAFGISVFLILFFANAYNFSDGLDWLAGTILAALGTGLLVASVVIGRGQWEMPIAAVLGGLLPFLVLNRPPAKVFMGDVGSMAIGGLLGLAVADLAHMGPLANHESGRYGIWIGLLIFSIVMMIELVPVPLQILSVKLRKKRLFPMTPIHHAYQKAGWPEIKIVGMFFGIQVACSAIGLLLIYQAVR